MSKAKTTLGKSITLGLILLIALVGCNPGPGPISSTPTPTKSPKPTFTPLPPTPTEAPHTNPLPTEPPPPTETPTLLPPTPTVTATPTQAVSDLCPLTGQGLADPSLARRRPFAVKVGNSPGARPQSGLSKADMVFEHLTEGGVTRFTALYLCQESQAIGPVRSARLIDLQLVPMFDAIFAHVGASAPIMEMIAQSEIAKANLDDYYGMPGFHLIPTRKRPFSTYTSTQELKEAATKLGIRQEAALEPLAFSDTPPAGGKAATSIAIPYHRTLSNVAYQYDADRGAYLRSTSGEPDLEALTSEPLVITNVVVVHAPHTETEIIEDTLGSRSVQITLTGRGEATLFRDGLAYSATWVREVPEQIVRYVDADGEPVPLKPGNVWVEVVSTDLEIEFE
jgi:hypothetical protein